MFTHPEMSGAYTKMGLCLLLPFLAVWSKAEMIPDHPVRGQQQGTVTAPPPPGHGYGTLFPEQLTGAFTGGFGEETCRSCHFDYPLNPKGGSLELEGVPDRYQPGQSYTLTVTLRREDLQLGGFQLTARHPDSTQAGRFELKSPRLQFTRGLAGVRYVQHSKKGTEPGEDGVIRWQVPWIAPESGREVHFNLAANAGNGDASAFGDFIFSLGKRSASAE